MLFFYVPMHLKFVQCNPKGYQWFDLTTEKEEVVLEKSLIAEKKLNKFLDQVFANLKITI